MAVHDNSLVSKMCTLFCASPFNTPPKVTSRCPLTAVVKLSAWGAGPEVSHRSHVLEEVLKTNNPSAHVNDPSLSIPPNKNSSSSMALVVEDTCLVLWHIVITSVDIHYLNVGPSLGVGISPLTSATLHW